MQINIRYDNSFQTVEVTEAECESMIRADYEDRIAMSSNSTSVQMRTMQQIMDDHFNKPEYNNYKREHRRTLSLDARLYEGADYVDPDAEFQTEIEHGDTLAELRAAIQELEPQQQELIYRIFFNNERPIDIARETGVSKQAIDDRLNKILRRLKKILKKYDGGA